MGITRSAFAAKPFHKYRAQATWVDGIRFPSKREAKRYQELKMLERAGEIRNLELQPSFAIEVIDPRNGEVIKVATYRADFRYIEAGYRPFQDSTVVEDVKGMKTETYKLKKKLVEALYGISITEVR